MSRGLHRAPSRLARLLDRWFTQPFLIQWLIAAVLVILLAGFLRAASEARHATRPTVPTVPVISAPPSPTPKVVSR